MIKNEFSRKDILGSELWEHFQGGEFWNAKSKQELINVLEEEKK